MTALKPVRTFVHVFKGSVSDLQYYLDILNAPLKFSIKFVCAFYLILGVVLTALFTFSDLPKIRSILNQVETNVLSALPDDIFFIWSNQTLNSNQISPIEIPLQELDQATVSPENLLIIDTSNDQKPDQIPSILFLNQKKLYTNSLSGDFNEISLNELIEQEEATYNKADIQVILSQSKAFFNDVLDILPFFAYIVLSLGLFVVRLFMVAIDAIIFQFLFQILNKPIKYLKVFQLSLHLLVPVEILHQLTRLFFPTLNFPMLTVGFWSLALLLIWHFRNLHVFRVEVKKKKS